MAPEPIGQGGITKSHGNIQILDFKYDDPMQVDLQKENNSMQDNKTGSNTSGQHMLQPENVKVFNLKKHHVYNKCNIHVFIEKTNSENIGRLHPLQAGHLLHQ